MKLSTNSMNTKREFRYHVVNKINSVLLSVLLVDSWCSDTGSIINSCALKAPEILAIRSFKFEEFDINLNVVSLYSVYIALGLHGPFLSVLREVI